MRKIYSLVLMTAMLLVGTNVWADDITVVNHTKGTTPAVTSLQEAVDCADPGDSITITLNNNIILNEAVVIPHVTGTIDASHPNVLNRTGQRICLNMNGHNISGNDNASSGYGCIQILKGTLNITGTGEIKRPAKKGKNNADKSVITVYGAPWAIKDAVWTVVTIGENVTLNSNTPVPGETNKGNEDNKVFGLCIQTLDALPSCYTSDDKKSTGHIGYETKVAHTTASSTAPNPFGADTCAVQSQSNPKSWSAGCAYGIKVFVHGKIFGHYRGINVVGTINATPECDITSSPTQRQYATYPYYDYNYPYVKIYPTATVWCIDDGISNDGNGGIYAGGYVVWDISGYVHGQTGILVKAGDFILTDATVASDSQNGSNSGNYHSGDVSGSGIFITTDQGYAGSTGVTLEGDTKVTGNGSAAITDVLATNADQSVVSHLDIDGGTIEAGAGGAINMTSGTATTTTVSGGSIQGTVTKTDPETGTETVEVVTLTPTDGSAHATTVVIDGKETVVVTPGAAPTTEQTKTSWSDIALFASGSNAKWDGTGDTNGVGVIASGTTKILGEVQIISATATEKQELTIENNATLIVKQLMMNEYAKIIVEAGGKLIVNGTQGIIAPSVNNITLKTSEANPAIFLFDPVVTSNRHPKATVEYKSKAYKAGDDNFIVQFFGVPMDDGIVDEIVPSSNVYKTQIDVWRQTAWDNIGVLNGTTGMNYSKFNIPFGFYSLKSNNPSNELQSYQIKGSLVGNTSPERPLYIGWTAISNAYTGVIDHNQLFTYMVNRVTNDGSNIQPAIYLYTQEGNHLVWEAYTPAKGTAWSALKINPMNAFMFKNNGDIFESVSMSYNNMVWTPANASAPARQRQFTNLSRINMHVDSENGLYDKLTLAQSDDFDAEIDVYDAEQYMNDDVNFYAMSDEKLAILATNDMENTYLGFSCVNGGTFTITFDEVEGDEMVLVDLLTNARVAITQGMTYQFTASDNETNDYRFKVVSRQEMPTDVDVIQNENTDKGGIYTITGQYVGEMNMWNILPAGVYIVNGDKKVK